MHHALTPRWLAVPAVLLAAGLAAAPDHAEAAAPVTAKIAESTLRVTGDASAQTLALRLVAGNTALLAVDVGDNGSADFIFRRDKFDHILVKAGGGDDSVRIDDSAGVFTDTEQTTLDGEAGADSLAGGFGPEVVAGGDGSDMVTGGRGNDLALLGAGDDVAAWSPGDGSDTLEGQADHDTLRFNTSNVGEQIALSANNGRLRLTRDVAGIVLDADGLEAVALNTLGGADTISVGDLTGTDVTAVTADLAGTLGGSAGDGLVDNVVVAGTNGDDAIAVAGSSGSAAVTGLAARVDVAHPDPTDRLTIDTLAGADTVDSSALAAGTLALTVN